MNDFKRINFFSISTTLVWIKKLVFLLKICINILMEIFTFLTNKYMLSSFFSNTDCSFNEEKYCQSHKYA